MIVVLDDASIPGERGVCDIDGAGDVYIVTSCGDCCVRGEGGNL